MSVLGLPRELYVKFHPRWVYHHSTTDVTETELPEGVKYHERRMAVHRHVKSGKEVRVTYRPARWKTYIEWDDGETTVVSQSSTLL